MAFKVIVASADRFLVGIETILGQLREENAQLRGLLESLSEGMSYTWLLAISVNQY